MVDTIKTTLISILLSFNDLTLSVCMDSYSIIINFIQGTIEAKFSDRLIELERGQISSRELHAEQPRFKLSPLRIS